MADTTAGDISIDFSTEELVALADVLGCTPPPGIGPEPLGDIDDSTRAMLISAAARALIARRVMTSTDAGYNVIPVVASLLEVLTTPALLARAAREADGFAETRFYSALPTVAAEHTPLVDSVHRFTPFATEELLARQLRFTGLEDRPQPGVAAFAVTYGALEACAEQLAAGEAEAAAKTLAAAADDEVAATTFVAALGSKVASSQVTILYRPDNTHVEGGDLTWVDCGEAGLWLTPTPDLSPEPGEDEPDNGGATDGGLPPSARDQPVTIEPTTAEQIARELLSYLPGESKESVDQPVS